MREEVITYIGSRKGHTIVWLFYIWAAEDLTVP